MAVSELRVREALKRSGVAVRFELLPAEVSFQDNGVDSMDMMNMLLEIEEEFAVKIPDEDTGQIDSIQSIINYLQDRAT